MGLILTPQSGEFFVIGVPHPLRNLHPDDGLGRLPVTLSRVWLKQPPSAKLASRCTRTTLENYWLTRKNKAQV
jgi:hypothetical protein